jgi:serine/threonine-protein kinase
MVEAAIQLGRVPELTKYELLEEIGHGGMATVYRARDRRLGREVAVKVIHPHLRESGEVAARFHVEARAVAKLRHRNIVEIYDVGSQEEPERYLVAELVLGTTLGKLRRERGVLPPEIAGAIALELLDALAHAHASGVVHRDVKPENVLIRHRLGPEYDEDDPASSGRVAIKLTDFGIAKLLDATGVTSTGQVLGSPAHMAPEQIEGGEVDARSDVFGLGVVLYDCIVGHLPFEGGNPAQVLRRVLDGEYTPAQRERPVAGARWSALIDRAIARAAADRFQSAREMREAILAEMDRVGFGSPRRELEAWFDRPDVYEEELKGRLLERLRARGDEARKRADVLSAASDYNRALALAPDDARLMRVVSGMHRARMRARALWWALLALVLLAAAGASFRFVSSSVRARSIKALIPGAPQAIATLLPFPASSAVPATNAQISAPTVRAAPSALTSPRARDATPAKPVDRTFTLDLRPPMGVSVSIDGKPEHPVSSGDTLTLDLQEHALLFSCPVCNVVERGIAAGDKGETLHVDVPVKPATLVIEGNPGNHFQVVQHPELRVYVGKNPVRLKSAYELVTVEEIETSTEHQLRLEAGQAVSVSFE